MTDAQIRSRIAVILLGAGLFVTAANRATASEASVAPREPQLIASPESGWPQFRGPRRDGISDETGLLKSWPEGGPKMIWSIDGLGRGYSSSVISEGRLIVTGDFNHELHILAFDLMGQPLWRATNGLGWLRPYPGARSSVTYSDGRIYHQNARGRVACFDASTGKELWSLNALEQFGGENITWGLSECLLIDDKAVYVTAGGREALLVALDKKTGKPIWTSKPLPHLDEEGAVESASYTSPILVEFAGRRLIIGCSLRQLYCVDADSGEIHWTRPVPTSYGVLAMQPALVNGGVFMTAPHGDPGAFYKFIPPPTPSDELDVEQVWTTTLDTCQGGVVAVDGRLFGAYYPGRKGWAAVDAATGEILFEEPGIVKGAVLHADDRLYILSEDGWVRLIEPANSEFRIHGEFRFSEDNERDVWAHPVIHDAKLYLRYNETLACFDVRR